MLAAKALPPEYALWNRQVGAPMGKIPRALGHVLPEELFARLGGPFSVQPNSRTRRFEYPWAFHAVPVAGGPRVLEIGGGLSGFQFVLSRAGCRVVNVDPGMEAKGLGWPCTPEAMAKLNRIFGTSVELRNTAADAASLEPESFDIAYCISVLEHLPEAEAEGTVEIVYRSLKPGGYFVITVDFFLDLAPMTGARQNKWGRNIDVQRLAQIAPFALHRGDPAELHGFAEFSPDDIRANLNSYLVGDYPVLAQCLVLRKPA